MADEAPLPTGRVAIVDPEGSVSSIERREMPDAIRAGYRPASADELDRARYAAASEGPIGAGAAAFLGGLGQVTLGASDEALPKLAGYLGTPDDEAQARAAMGALYETQPAAKMVGEVGSMLLPGALGGANKLISGAGELAEAGAGALAKRAIGEGILSKAAAYGARGAVEAGIYGVGQTVSESALTDDYDHFSEKLLANMGESALFGAGLGGAFGVAAGAAQKGYTAALGGARNAVDKAAAWLPKARAADVDAVVGAEGAAHAIPRGDAAAFGTGAVGLTDKAADALIDYQFAGQPKDAAAAREAYRRGTTVLSRADEETQTAIRDVRQSLDSALSAARSASEASFADKADQMAHLVDKAKVAEARNAFREAWADAKDTIDMIRADIGQGNRTLERRLEAYDGRAKRILEGAPENIARDLFIMTDDMKRAVGQYAEFGKNVNGNPAAQAYARLYERIRATLEQPAAWGERAALAQKEINKASNIEFNIVQAFETFCARRLEQSAGRPIFRADPEKIGSMIAMMGDERGALAREALQRYVDALDDRMATIKRHYRLTDGQAAQFAAGEAAIKRFRVTFDEAAKRAEMINRVRALQASEARSANIGRLVGGGIGGVIGSALGIGGGFGGASAGALVGEAFTSPIRTVERLAALRRVAEKFDAKVGPAVDRAIRGAPAAADKSIPVGSARKEWFRERASAIASLAGNAQATAARFSEHLGDLQKHAPKTAVAMATVTQRAIAYLASKLPGATTPVSIFDRKKRDATDAEIFRWAKLYSYAADPIKAVDDLTPDSVDVLKNVWPKIYEQIRGRALDELSRTDAFIPMQRRQRLAALFDIRDGLMSQAAQEEIIASRQGDAQQSKNAPNRPIRTDSAAIMTPVQQTQSR